MENKLVPKLRFPEFYNDREWGSKKLGILCKVITKGTTPTTLGYNYVNSGVNFIKIEAIQNGKINLKKVAYIEEECNEVLKRSQLKEKDILFSIAGALGIVTEVEKNILPANTNQALAIVRLNNDVNVSYVIKYLGSEKITNEVLKLKAGAAQPNISLSQLANFDILIPCSKEQQKIAACLSSLDDLITAENEKLDVLKNYKKGLMQQLFPAEGHKVPKLRFPEFKDNGEWEDKKFESVVNIIDGDRGLNYPKAEDFTESGFCIFLNAKNVTKQGFIFDNLQFITKEKDDAMRKGKLKRLDVILTTRGSVGQFAYYDENVTFENMRINSGMVILRANSNLISPDFLYEFCKSELISAYVNNNAFGNAQQQLTVSLIKNLPIQYPIDKAEQQKIAACLSSLNDQILAQTQKIDKLKLHKKGLMQQLFPTIN